MDILPIKYILFMLGLLGVVLCENDQSSVIASKTNALTEALFDPTTAFQAYPNVRQARTGGIGALAEALGGGTSSGFFGSMFSGLTGMISKFSSSLGGPAIPAAMAKALDGASAAAAAPPAPGAWKPPRMSKPGPDVFRQMDAKKKRIKGIRTKRQISVKTFKAFDGAGPNMVHGSSPFSGELLQILQAVAKMMSGAGSITRTPVTKMKGHMDSFRDGAEKLVTKVSDLPNAVFGMLRSKRELIAETAFTTDNEVKITVAELAKAHQKNWFTYLRSYNGTATECQELEFCRTAQANNDLQSQTARSGGKILSYLVSGLKDSRGRTGDRMTQAVDCCLSDDLVQAEACQNFYLQQCLEADLTYEPPARD
ncbi:hypothetical protein BV898_02424 [Hypsibius exemplaris]|uniref:Uncharacterized protein n=1 Tax=Hypsibius exemplaris TaxID=2072580 RepID=A0A1W0X812_HYPEX|nr:hypothetical protein BV898_02424 [Hypsibius exemplaris]